MILCKSRIDDLVFAKTSQGIYCMNCHNERMAKIRSHAQKKAERERERKTGGSASSTKSRARAAHQAGTNGASDHSIPQTLNAMSPRSTDVLPSTRSVAKPISSYVSDAFEPSSSISVTIAPPAESGHVPLPPYPYKPNISLESERGNPLKQSTLPAVPSFSANVREERRRSYDDGVRPLNILFNKDESSHQTANTPATLSAVTDTLIAPTSRQDKRRSINPGKSLFERNAHPSTQTSQLSLSPLSHTFPSNPSADRAPTPPIPNGRETHLTTLSPLRDQFPPRSPSLSRPTSHVSLQRSNSSRNSSSSSGLPYFDEQDRSQPSSPTRSDHSEDQTIVITAPSSTVAVGSVPPAKTRTKVQQSVNVGDDGSRLSTETKELETIGPSADGIRRSESRPNSSASLGAYSVSRSRSVSPAHRADVPHGIESETDTDPEDGFEEQQTSKSSVVPTLLTNDLEESLGSADGVVIEEADPTTPLLESGSEDLSESSPVEHTSHSTFIAPALPPIRLSLSSNDFSEIFSSVGGFPSRMSLSHLAKIPEAEKAGLPTVTDYDANITPTIRPPFLPSMVEESEAEDDTIKPEGMFPLSTVLPVINGQVSFENPDYPPIPPTKPLKVSGGFRRSSTPEGSQSLLTTGNNAATSSVSYATSNHSDSMLTRITLTEPDSKGSTTISEDGREDLVTARLQEAVADARERGVPLKIDRAFVEAILSTLQMQRAEYVQLKSKFDGIKRTSRQYIEGLTVAQAEYDRELEARRDAEAEVTRLRVLLSGQVAKLTALSGDNRKEKLREQLSKELHENLSGLELDLSNLKVERDMALAEVEELEATKSGSTDLPPANLGRSLTKRLESIKHQYRRDLVPLTKEKESLQREIAELKAVRDVFLEETTVLNARNEELAQLSAAYSRRIETVPEAPPNDYHDHGRALSMDHQRAQPSYHPPPVSMSHSFSSSTSSTLHEETIDLRPPKVQKQDSDHTPSKSKFMKWGSRSKEPIAQPIVPEKKIAPLQHNFQQLSVLRFTRCDHCGDKMWGSQLRCTGSDLVLSLRKDVLCCLRQFARFPFMCDASLNCRHRVFSTSTPTSNRSSHLHLYVR
ncbi:hypothetical protein H0H93_008633 [Arthromyces matolae]|nr:hypothetical protein H0H93_008633 [Arthromyces matolae]